MNEPRSTWNHLAGAAIAGSLVGAWGELHWSPPSVARGNAYRFLVLAVTKTNTLSLPDVPSPSAT